MPSTFIKLAGLISFLAIPGCREFYDEEFDDSNVAVSAEQNRTYKATLQSTDPNLSAISGDSEVIVRDGDVRVDVNLSGIPQNIIQIHYGFISSDCSILTFAIPNEPGLERNYNISENLSTSALDLDLQSSGASNASGDINLEGKSFVIKAFSNFSGLPNPTGTNSLVIACGRLDVSSEGEVIEAEPITNPNPVTTPASPPLP